MLQNKYSGYTRNQIHCTESKNLTRDRLRVITSLSAAEYFLLLPTEYDLKMRHINKQSTVDIFSISSRFCYKLGVGSRVHVCARRGKFNPLLCINSITKVAFWVDRKRLEQQHLGVGKFRVLLAATEIKQQEANIQLTAEHRQG